MMTIIIMSPSVLLKLIMFVSRLFADGKLSRNKIAYATPTKLRDEVVQVCSVSDVGLKSIY